MGKLKVFVSTGESRTADGIIKELLEGNSPFKQYVEQVTTIYPPDIPTTNDELVNLGAKVLQMSIENSQPHEIADKLKGQDVAILIPPASQKKAQLCTTLCQAIKEAGVKNVVIVSAVGANMVDKQSLKMFKEIEEGAKRALPDSKMCIARAGHYFQNLLLYGKQMREQGFLGLPTENKPMTLVDARDVAGAITNIAVNNGNPISEAHLGECYEFAGVEQVTGSDIVDMCRAKGFNIDFKNIPRTEAEKYLRALKDVDESEIQCIQDQFDLVREGLMAGGSTHLKQVLGREPLTIREFVEEYLPSFQGREE